jgi:dTDP-4-amino-4,6-dideoxygalactose transaminase
MIPIAKPYLTEDEAMAAHDAVLSGWVTQGPRVKEFEDRFAARVDAPHAVAVSSCTTALHLALLVCGVKPGDEVICPSMSYVATSNSILYCGARPVFAEVEPQTYNIDIEHARSLMNERTKAMLIVHQMGMPADIDAFAGLCRDRGIALVEDAACATGSRYKGCPIGSHTDLACFSFHPRKVITTGDGGMITTSRPEYDERLRLLRQHGMSVNDRVRHEATKLIFEDHVEIGYNYRMTDIQAAVGIRQLEKLDFIVGRRRKIAAYYNDAFSDIECLRVPEEPGDRFSNYQSYSLYLRQSAPLTRNELMARLLEKGITTRRGIMTSHRETAYRQLFEHIFLPVSEDLSDRSILLPLYPGLTDEETAYVAAAVRDEVAP